MNEHVATTVIRLDEAIAAPGIKELDRTCHCHWEAPNPRCHRPSRPTARLDILLRGRASAVLGPQSLRQPPSEAERQSQRRNVNLNTCCGKVLKLIFTGNPIEPMVAIATTQRLGERWQQDRKLICKCPRRIDHDQTAATERALRRCWPDR